MMDHTPCSTKGKEKMVINETQENRDAVEMDMENPIIAERLNREKEIMLNNRLPDSFPKQRMDGDLLNIEQGQGSTMKVQIQPSRIVVHQIGSTIIDVQPTPTRSNLPRLQITPSRRSDPANPSRASISQRLRRQRESTEQGETRHTRRLDSPSSTTSLEMQNILHQSELPMGEAIEHRENSPSQQGRQAREPSTPPNPSRASISQRLRRQREATEQAEVRRTRSRLNLDSPSSPTSLEMQNILHQNELPMEATEHRENSISERGRQAREPSTPTNPSRASISQRLRRQREATEQAEARHTRRRLNLDSPSSTTRIERQNILQQNELPTVEATEHGENSLSRRQRQAREPSDGGENPSRASVSQRSRRQREATGQAEARLTRRRLNLDSPLSATSIESQSIRHPIENLSFEEAEPMEFEGRHYLGKMDVICRHCGALHWIDEKLSNSSLRNPQFGKCCLSGKIRLPALREPPPVLKALYDGNDLASKSFRNHIRQYNAANAFTSLGCTMEPRVLNGRGPYSFTIHGELRHRTGSLLPEDGTEPTYSQLYIYDPISAHNSRQRRNPTLDRGVLMTIQEVLLGSNVFVQYYRQAHEILSQTESSNHHVPAYLHYSSNKDRRRYNEPTAEEIAIILPGDGSQISGLRDIVIHLRDSTLMKINECHPAYLPLHYVLLFPFGELGWSEDLQHWDVEANTPKLDKRVSMKEYYSYRLFQRQTEYSTILRAEKLFQEFLVDVWAATEQNRLNYCRHNQADFRFDCYKDLAELHDQSGPTANEMGQRFILPSTFTGSPRQMYEVFQDSMAITRHFKHPDIFLTMTANPSWPEIKEALLSNQTPNDRAEIIARIFELKRKCLMDEIKKNRVFGEVVAYVYTIEFQKRGLPHMHTLFFLGEADKIRTVEQVDRIISAEFPNENDASLFNTIKRCMIHGPCGDRNSSAPCLENGFCTKNYPRAFVETTDIDRDGYPTYRRRANGPMYIIHGKEVNNGDVVPYNPHLSRMFNCHINVEVCAGIRCVKYIHKYIYKGHDRTTMVLGTGDEIKQYLDARYIGPPEAAWRLFGYRLHQEHPNVIRLCLHLPGEQQVVYHARQSNRRVRQQAEQYRTKLMAFFDCCALDEAARAYTYQEIPSHYTWQDTGSFWKPREQERGTIGRIYFASPKSYERFYLRLLLLNVKGPRSFEDLRTFNNVLHDTFKSACIARGLLEDDGEWVQCLEEAAIMNTGYQLRRLFGVILTQCSPTHPAELWNKFAIDICDDLPHKLRTMFGIQNPTETQITDYGLHLLNQILEEYGKSLIDFPPMPQPVQNWSVHFGSNRLIWEHRQLQFDPQTLNAQANVDQLNEEQRLTYDAVTSSVIENEGKIFFLNGGAGTGKTFLYNTIAAKCRSLGYIVICAASSGIASLLLVGGRTAHSTFSIPIDVLENSICNFTKQSMQAGLFREAKLIIWDEVPMQHRHCVEAVDRALQDVRNTEKLFGGITVVLGGDFRQTLPVISRGVREEIVGASLRRSPIWNGILIYTLTLNMRLNSREPSDVEFARYLIEVGENSQGTIILPLAMKKLYNTRDLIHSVYPLLSVEGTASSEFLTNRTILSARNDDVNDINVEALHLFPGETITYLAADKYSGDDTNDSVTTNRYPIEYLNSLNPSGLPPHRLELKIGCPIILLRNIAPKNGLCNGTRLKVIQCGERIIQGEILNGDKAGNKVLIPRISLSPTSTELIIPMTRRQFPIRLAFAMTINKSQGQSVKFVGIDLRTPVFSHGQLYVALSRCTSFNRISVLLPQQSTGSTTNVVYPEVLLPREAPDSTIDINNPGIQS